MIATDLSYFKRQEIKGKRPNTRGQIKEYIVYEAMEKIVCGHCGKNITQGDLFLFKKKEEKPLPACNDCLNFKVSGGEPLGIDDQCRARVLAKREAREKHKEKEATGAEKVSKKKKEEALLHGI